MLFIILLYLFLFLFSLFINASCHSSLFNFYFYLLTLLPILSSFHGTPMTPYFTLGIEKLNMHLSCRWWTYSTDHREATLAWVAAWQLSTSGLHMHRVNSQKHLDTGTIQRLDTAVDRNHPAERFPPGGLCLLCWSELVPAWAVFRLRTRLWVYDGPLKHIDPHCS